jgi:dolichol-phosphate mannosyltransferase
MLKKPKVVIILPTYNEVENIEAAITDITQSIKTINNKYLFTILVVDDRSPDGTAKIVQELGRKDKRLLLLSGPKAGLGKAMIRGLKYALKTLKADIVISDEADLAYEGKHIPYALKKIDEGFDLVVASRHVPEGETKGWSYSRKFNHWMANYFFASLVAGVSSVHDHNGAFRAVRVKNVLEKVKLEDLPKGFGFFNYWLFKLTQLTDKIHEFPVTYHFRVRGESKVSFNPKYFLTYLRDVKEYIGLCFLIRFEKISSN